LLFALANGVLDAGGLPGCVASRAAAVREVAEHELTVESQPVDGHVWFVDAPASTSSEPPASCDVVLCCTDATDATDSTDAAVRSVLAQLDVAVTLHLVGDGGGEELLRRYGNRPNVLLHRNPTRQGLFRTLHDRVPYLRSDFVAVQDPATTSRPRRLADSVQHLTDYGADLLAAAMQTPDGIERPLLPGKSYGRAVAPETLVFRRSALVDMGGMADRPDDADVEFVFRAAQERRLMLLSRSVTVDCAGSPARREVARPPSYCPRDGTLRHHAIGFPAVTVACDVVLPFHGQLDFVREALASLLDQEGAELVVHLIDDASPCPTEAFLRQWNCHPQVRTYRNDENIGPYSSFNNVLPFLTTDLVAVQDGDDISLPHRIHQAGNALRLADAEIFGARTRPFGAEALLGPSSTRAGGVKTVARAPYRSSRVPPRQPLGHLIEHPTAVYRTEAFSRLGGFSDFGRTDRNCCSLDTEFYLRAAYGGARFAVSNQVALLYRCHAESATQNAVTGWGSAARAWTLRECRRRAHRFQIKPFAPTAYSGIGRYSGLTRRFS
jgi:hypothetical protein